MGISKLNVVLFGSLLFSVLYYRVDPPPPPRHQTPAIELKPIEENGEGTVDGREIKVTVVEQTRESEEKEVEIMSTTSTTPYPYRPESADDKSVYFGRSGRLRKTTWN